ncbi:hypothetical protein [Paenibacillus sp. FSL H7-0331]|uniref:hypothetical protein n=1 Tax=Paenibacillus sp. FSL H7-0331 TaxID=1920421 RepID=UPI0015C3F989|nr:hypothetical protein [Paenibacillus sp. FSL H7-0331]
MNKEDLIEDLEDRFSHRKYIDCLGCSNSFSTKNDELYCVIKSKLVEEEDVCPEYN